MKIQWNCHLFPIKLQFLKLRVLEFSKFKFLFIVNHFWKLFEGNCLGQCKEQIWCWKSFLKLSKSRFDWGRRSWRAEFENLLENWFILYSLRFVSRMRRLAGRLRILLERRGTRVRIPASPFVCFSACLPFSLVCLILFYPFLFYLIHLHLIVYYLRYLKKTKKYILLDY